MTTLKQLPSDLFYRVQPLFREQIDRHLFCAGVLAGKYPGQVVVDNLERPRSAAVFTGGMWCYLGGDPNNVAFNQAFGAALSAKQIVDKEAWALLFNIPSDEWRLVLGSLVEDRLPIPKPRFFYVVDAEHFKAPPPIPDGFSLCFMDQSLKTKVRGELPDAVQNVLDLRAKNETPDQIAFGYVVIHDQTCVSWSMVDYIVGAHGEIGLQTKPVYQRQGLGLVVSGATMQYGLAHGLTQIHWDVLSHNIPSIRMAEKHGLRFSFEYDQNLIVFEKMSYLANLSWDHLDGNRFQETLDVGERLLELEDGQMYGHYLTGAAHAGLGRKEKAFFHLNKTLDHGWDDMAELENCAALKVFHSTAEWDAIMARLKNNIKSS